jgi:hypothetical protein
LRVFAKRKSTFYLPTNRSLLDKPKGRIQEESIRGNMNGEDKKKRKEIIKQIKEEEAQKWE